MKCPVVFLAIDLNRSKEIGLRVGKGVYVN